MPSHTGYNAFIDDHKPILVQLAPMPGKDSTVSNPSDKPRQRD
ncbi:MAG: hypothetical protein ABI389_02325 [Rhodanobacter sp.]